MYLLLLQNITNDKAVVSEHKSVSVISQQSIVNTPLNEVYKITIYDLKINLFLY